jgi:hypothetical protein
MSSILIPLNFWDNLAALLVGNESPSIALSPSQGRLKWCTLTCSATHRLYVCGEKQSFLVFQNHALQTEYISL